MKSTKQVVWAIEAMIRDTASSVGIEPSPMAGHVVATVDTLELAQKISDSYVLVPRSELRPVVPMPFDGSLVAGSVKCVSNTSSPETFYRMAAENLSMALHLDSKRRSAQRQAALKRLPVYNQMFPENPYEESEWLEVHDSLSATEIRAIDFVVNQQETDSWRGCDEPMGK